MFLCDLIRHSYLKDIYWLQTKSNWNLGDSYYYRVVSPTIKVGIRSGPMPCLARNIIHFQLLAFPNPAPALFLPPITPRQISESLSHQPMTSYDCRRSSQVTLLASEAHTLLGLCLVRGRSIGNMLGLQDMGGGVLGESQYSPSCLLNTFIYIIIDLSKCKIHQYKFCCVSKPSVYLKVILEERMFLKYLRSNCFLILKIFI